MGIYRVGGRKGGGVDRGWVGVCRGVWVWVGVWIGGWVWVGVWIGRWVWVGVWIGGWVCGGGVDRVVGVGVGVCRVGVRQGGGCGSTWGGGIQGGGGVGGVGGGACH